MELTPFAALVYRRGLNVKELAAKARVSRQTIHTWISGRSVRFRPDKVVTVAKALGVTVDELVTALHETRAEFEQSQE